MARARPGHQPDDSAPVSQAELDEIVRQLRETLPGLIADTQRQPQPPRPLPAAPIDNRLAMARFAAGMLIPAALVAGIALVRQLFG